MSKHLVIVESPAKAKTIEKYLGKDYAVKSSFGHIRDLPKKGLSIDIPAGFQPTYEISADKKKVVAELKKAAKDAREVWLASDEDREGEAIAWHLTQALRLDPAATKRIVFHEITKKAIEHAIENPRTIDRNLVDAQQARRILDRLVGYELSPVLWKKVRTGLSAGRVQSVAVRLIVEREREIKAFEPVSSYKVIARFLSKGEPFEAELDSRFTTPEEAEAFLRSNIHAHYTVQAMTQKPATRNPGPPFTTSSLQQEASRRLGFGVKQTMTLAQRLYENGHITYMRTDSLTLSTQAIAAAGEYITQNFGKKYHHQRQFKTKNASAQEAHEAIRPTNFSTSQAGADEAQRKLYKLIWQRTTASQMSAAELKSTEIIIDITGHSEHFVAKGEQLVFDGYYKVYGKAKPDSLLPAMQKGDRLQLDTMQASQIYSRAPARYSEASLVKKLEELGIGRPSTYAPTISTIQTRGYVEKRDLEGTPRDLSVIALKNNQITSQVTSEVSGADRGKLLPTPTAEMTTDFLVKYFSEIVDYDFTATAEAGFDSIAAGKEKWEAMIRQFYSRFHPLVEKSEKASRQEAAQARLLGKDPKSGRSVYARYGRYGAMLQIGEASEEEEKPLFAPLPQGKTMDDVTLKEALAMFTLPRKVGKTADGQEISANIGRYGPYIKVGKLFVSIKGSDPLVITEAEARQFYDEKQKQLANKYIQEFSSSLKVANGPYGPYVTDGKKNARIPKETDAATLTEQEAKQLLQAAPAKKRFRRKRA